MQEEKRKKNSGEKREKLRGTSVSGCGSLRVVRRSKDVHISQTTGVQAGCEEHKKQAEG